MADEGKREGEEIKGRISYKSSIGFRNRRKSLKRTMSHRIYLEVEVGEAEAEVYKEVVCSQTKEYVA